MFTQNFDTNQLAEGLIYMMGGSRLPKISFEDWYKSLKPNQYAKRVKNSAGFYLWGHDACRHHAMITPLGFDSSLYTPTEDEKFVYELQHGICQQLDIETDFIDFLKAPQLTQVILCPHQQSKLKSLCSDGTVLTIQSILNISQEPILTVEDGNLVIGLPREDRQFCLFTDYMNKYPSIELKMAIGVNSRNELVQVELSGQSLQHFCLGGAPRQGKSQAILSMIGSLTCRYSPDQIKFICMDGKGGVTMGFLNGSPYLLKPVAMTKEDAEALAVEIKRMTDERYALFRQVNAQTLDDYNQKVNQPLPYVGVFIDEFQDLYSFGRKAKKGEVDTTGIFESVSSLTSSRDFHCLVISKN